MPLDNSQHYLLSSSSSQLLMQNKICKAKICGWRRHSFFPVIITKGFI
jgi:hypothetical protein